MIVSHQHRFIFVKTHKTAGSSLEVALARECAAQDIVSHMEDNIASGLPRNYGPTSALGPWYNRSRLLRKLVHRHSPLLGAYYYEHMPAWRIRELVGEEVWGSYFTFCFDRIYEFRELPAALADLRARLGLALPEPLPREKATVAPTRKPYRDYYDDAGREQIGRLYAREIALLGYRFGD